MSATPFADSAVDYHRRGWSPVPLPPGCKKPPPTGWTGYAAPYASGADVHEWARNGHATSNIGLRMPETVLGLDLDAYDGKPGLETMLAATDRLGPLPPSPRSSSRPDDPVSGIRFYRVPPGRRWADVLGPGVEIIHYGHRYACVAPSLHPEGRDYAWYAPGNTVIDSPAVDELPDLPAAWVADLDRGDVATRSEKADLIGAEVTAWLAARPLGEPCRYMMRLLGEAEVQLEVAASRHDTVRGYIGRMVRAGDQGHRGSVTGLDSLQSLWQASLSRGKAREPDQGEWDRMVTGAVAIVVKTPTSVFNQGCCPAEPTPTPLPPVDVDPDWDQRESTGDEQTPVSNGDPEAPVYAFVPGGSFILDTPPNPDPLWGNGDEVLLADGEALIIAGRQGLGKTTMAGQLALGRCGFPEYAELLGFTITPGDRRVLYLAMDRPRQVARSFRRMVGEAWRQELDDRLVVWRGPPPADLAKFHGLLLDLCRKAGADTVVVDSLKDAAVGLTDDEVGAGYNRARQTAIEAGVQVVEGHHQRKAPNGAKTGHYTLDDLYGSTWLTSGVGSVVLLTGAPGDPIVGFHHLKQPASEVGPFKVIHDHDVGRSTIWHATDLVLAAKAASGGLSSVDAARLLFEVALPTPSQREKARRRLLSLEVAGHLVVVQAGDKAANQLTKWGAR